MKVMFTCEKCGHEYALHEVVRRSGHIQSGLWYYYWDNHVPCPNCAKLTYGPLTEEMVAEALTDAFHGERDGPKPGIPAQARFVLRLLRAVDGGAPEHVYGGVRDWLLELARRP